MLLAGYLMRPWAAVNYGSAPAGPAMTTLRSVAARIGRTVRCIAIAYIGVQVIIWHGFYAADPRRLAGPALAVLWATAAVIYLRRRWPVWQVACLDSVVHVVFAVGAMLCVPPAMRGDAANWLYIAMAGQLFIPTWFAPTVLSAPLALASAAAYWGSSVVTATPASAHNSPAASTALLLAIAAANWSGRRLLYRWASRADAALDRADQDARAQYVVLTRNVERREHERLLHDTVLNTLTALSRAGSGEPVAGRCRHDITLMEYVLGDSGRMNGSPVNGSPGNGATGNGDLANGALGNGSLLAGIEAVANEMRARGLEVHLEVTGGTPARDADLRAVPVPVPVAAALTHAVREALANVISHAGTTEAWVKIVETAPGAQATEPGGVRVTVRDAGAGFDPAHVDPARLGLRRSVVERLADSGGRASVRSAPGQGTVVSMHWSAPVPPEQPAAQDGRPGAPDPLAARRQAVGNLPRSELPRTIGTVAWVWQFALLLQVLIDLPDYRHPAVPLAVWLGLVAAAAWLIPRARARGLTTAQSAVAIAVAMTAVALVGWDRAQGATGTVDWSVFGTGWVLMLVTVSRPAWAWVTGALLIFTAHAVFAIRLLGTTPLSLARLTVTVYTLTVILAVFAALQLTFHAQARIFARRSVLASRSAAERAATAAVQQDRRGRLALLEADALPLLRGIAGGILDPADQRVQARCARLAATLRRALADGPRTAAGILAELEPALSAARARGLPVEVQVVGDPGRPLPEVAGATLAAVDGVMSALPPHPVMLTVLAAGDDVELYVTFDRLLRAAPDVAELRLTVPAMARWRSTVEVDDSGSGCLEVRWRNAVPA
jgi:signal transduction histidine kinase